MVMLDNMFIDLCISMDSDVMEIYGRNYDFYFFFRYSHYYHCGCLGLLLLVWSYLVDRWFCWIGNAWNYLVDRWGEGLATWWGSSSTCFPLVPAIALAVPVLGSRSVWLGSVSALSIWHAPDEGRHVLMRMRAIPRLRRFRNVALSPRFGIGRGGGADVAFRCWCY